jgi:hypothetical protein
MRMMLQHVERMGPRERGRVVREAGAIRRCLRVVD